MDGGCAELSRCRSQILFLPLGSDRLHLSAFLCPLSLSSLGPELPVNKCDVVRRTMKTKILHLHLPLAVLPCNIDAHTAPVGTSFRVSGGRRGPDVRYQNSPQQLRGHRPPATTASPKRTIRFIKSTTCIFPKSNLPKVTRNSHRRKTTLPEKEEKMLLSTPQQFPSHPEKYNFSHAFSADREMEPPRPPPYPENKGTYQIFTRS